MKLLVFIVCPVLCKVAPRRVRGLKPIGIYFITVQLIVAPAGVRGLKL